MIEQIQINNRELLQEAREIIQKDLEEDVRAYIHKRTTELVIEQMYRLKMNFEEKSQTRDIILNVEIR